MARKPTVTHSLAIVNETEIVVKWSSDSVIDFLWYSTDDGQSWTARAVGNLISGMYTIPALDPDTRYYVKTKVRRKDNKETAESVTIMVDTYQYPHLTNGAYFNIGEKVTLEFYNPKNRRFDFTIIGNGKEIYTWTISGTTYNGVNGEPAVTNLYNSIPNQLYGDYSVKVTYGDSVITRHGGSYFADPDVCSPTFSKFTCRDAETRVTAVTGNDQVYVKGLSQLQLEIPSANKMVAKNYATPSDYVVTVDEHEYTVPYSANNIIETLGVLNAIGTRRVKVAAYDSRGLYALATKDITVYDYKKPVANVTLKRLNNFENQTTLSVNGTYTPLAINGTNKNALQEVKYRYREKGGTWSAYKALSYTPSGSKFTCSAVTLDLDNSKEFEFEVYVADKLTNSTGVGSVGIGQAVLLVSSNKKLCYMNGKEMALREDVPTLVRYTNIPDNTDLNTIRTIGTYKSTSTAHTNTMSNVPTFSGGFKLIVSNWTGGEGYTTLLRQDIYFCDRRYTRYERNSTNNWTEWKQVALLDNIYPVGSVYITSENASPASTLGVGTWTLIDKEFASLYSNSTNGTSYFTASENVIDGGTYFIRGGNSILVRQKVTIDVGLDDNDFEVGYFNWENIGVTDIAFDLVEQMSISDGANGGFVYNVASADGKVTIKDIFDAPSTSGKVFYLEFVVVVPYTRMVDRACNRFYWKRTS